jgi:hypothetical protein
MACSGHTVATQQNAVSERKRSFAYELKLLLWYLPLQVLSVVAQQLLTIQNALKANLDKFWFEGRPIKLVPTCGVRC